MRRLSWLKGLQRAAAAAGRPTPPSTYDRTTQHNDVRDRALKDLKNQVADPQNIQKDCELFDPDGKRRIIDICYVHDGTISIWEVKSQGAAASGLKDLYFYAWVLQNGKSEYKGLTVELGFPVNWPPSVNRNTLPGVTP